MKLILLVEDDRNLSERCAEILERAGYHVVTVHDGDAALAAMKLILIDLLFVDVFLPGRDGFQLIADCREFRPGVPVLVMSGGGFTDPSTVLAQAARVGASGTLAKPFSVDELVSAVERIIGPAKRSEPVRRAQSA
jgi:DNA-binding response OmpR family regulator